jgi:nicotinate phosphoribosyltransferase
MGADSFLGAVYGGTSLALLTDLYQLTMAHGYWANGVAEREAVFHLFFRKPPFGGGYAVCAGIGPALEHLARLRFTDDDLAYLGRAVGFPPAFLAYLRELRLELTVDAVPEGRVVFAHEPLVRVRGPLLAAQLVETALLALVNFETLIATKASRVCHAAGGAPVIDFGLRRAQGPDGGLGATRAAWIGGVAGTSNVLAGKLFDIPVRGTHAHSWVMSFPDEPAAFRAYAAAMPAGCTFLVDTFDTLAGVRHAIAVGRELRAAGHELVGIRLDSGDLAHLSIEARALLDAGGFPAAQIVASNDLDETVIASLREQGARVDVWGVGTRLVTGDTQPALGGVYKLGAVRDEDGAWRDTIKVSEQPIKVSNPGVLGVRRLWHGDTIAGDLIYDADHGATEPLQLGDLDDLGRGVPAPTHDRTEELLVPMMDRGALLVSTTDLAAARARCQADLAALSPRTRRFLNPQPYPVGLDPALQRRKRALIEAQRGGGGDPAGSAGGAGAASPRGIDRALGRVGASP